MFYVIEISTGDSKVAGKSIYSYETEQMAVATFHQKMGTAIKSDLYDSELLMVIDENGNIIKRERFVRPIEPVVIEESGE